MATTLLQMVQGILSDANSDEVDAITDTVEAQQCARVIAGVCDDIVTQYDLQAAHKMFVLTPVASVDPQYDIPADIHSVEWIKFDKRLANSGAPSFLKVYYVTPDDFMERTNSRNTADTNVEEFTETVSGISLRILNDAPPTFYTLFDDRTVTFDSFVADVFDNASPDASALTQAYGQTYSTLAIADATVIPLPAELIPVLHNEARNLYMDLHVGGTTPETRRAAIRSRVRSQRLRRTMRNNQATELIYNTGPSYGRK